MEVENRFGAASFASEAQHRHDLCPAICFGLLKLYAAFSFLIGDAQRVGDGVCFFALDGHGGPFRVCAERVGSRGYSLTFYIQLYRLSEKKQAFFYSSMITGT